MRAKIVDENLIIHTVPLAEVHVGQIELYLDIFFDKEYAEVEKLMEIFPIKLRLKWKMGDKRPKRSCRTIGRILIFDKKCRKIARLCLKR